MSSRRFVQLACLVLTVCGLPGLAAAQLPFEITVDDLLAVDSTAVRWTSLQTYVGGVRGELSYHDRDTSDGECKAVAVLAAANLLDRYEREHGDEPASIRVNFRCGTSYNGMIDYDGVIVRLDLWDAASGLLVYRGRKRGLP